MRGVCYAHSWSRAGGRGYGSDDSARSLAALKALGITWVSLTPFGYQGGLSDDTVRMGNTWPGGETDEAVATEIKRAHELGIKVMLKPHIWVRGDAWCGHIQPGGGTPQAWGRWFASYRELVLHYARLAERHGADALVIGTELGTAVQAMGRHGWGRLITDVRALYKGRLTYAANWDVAERVDFWDLLDFASVQAYEPIAASDRPSRQELREGARKAVDRFERLHLATGMRIVLTEIGFRSARGAAAAPNSWPDHDKRSTADAFDPQLQASAYEVMPAELYARPWFGGAFWWKWFTWQDTSEEGPLGFAPKPPTLEVLRRWYLQRGSD